MARAATVFLSEGRSEVRPVLAAVQVLPESVDLKIPPPYVPA
jgi:hypothetical protein